MNREERGKMRSTIGFPRREQRQDFKSSPSQHPYVASPPTGLAQHLRDTCTQMMSGLGMGWGRDALLIPQKILATSKIFLPGAIF